MTMSDIGYNYICRHCEGTWTVPIDPYYERVVGGQVKRVMFRKVGGLYDIGPIHECDQAKAYRKRTAIMLAMQDRQCQYGCDRPCNHPYPERNKDATVANS